MEYRVVIGLPTSLEKTRQIQVIAESNGCKDYTIYKTPGRDTWSFAWSLPELLRLPNEVLDRMWGSEIKVISDSVRDSVWMWKVGQGTIPLRKNRYKCIDYYEWYFLGNDLKGSIHWEPEGPRTFRYVGISEWRKTPEELDREYDEVKKKLKRYGFENVEFGTEL